MKQYTTLTRQACIRVISCTLILLFAAHAFCFFNLTYSSPSVMFNAAKGNNAQTAAGTWLQPFYWRVRGVVASPLFIGLLCSAYITLTALLTCDLLGVSSLAGVFLLCGALSANSAVTSVLAAHLHTADAFFLSQLLGTAGVFLSMRMRFGFIPGIALIAAASGLGSAGFACSAALAVIAVIFDLIRGEDAKQILIRSAKTAAAFAVGTALYAAGYAVLLSRRGLDAAAALQLPQGGLLAAWAAPIRTLFAPLTAYTHANILLRLFLAALSIAALLLLLRSAGRCRRIAVLVLALTLPLCVNLPVFAASPAGQFPLSFIYLDVFAAVLFAAVQTKVPRLSRYAAAAFSILFLSATVFANQVYLKKNLEMQSTLSVMTRVIDRAEHTEGYRPGYTPVAIVGTLEDSVLSVPHRGFEHLAALDAAAGNYAIASAEDAIWYTYQIIGYPFNFVSLHEQSRLSSSDAVSAMPAFPAEGCVQFIGDTLVIKLSE